METKKDPILVKDLLQANPLLREDIGYGKRFRTIVTEQVIVQSIISVEIQNSSITKQICEELGVDYIG